LLAVPQFADVFLNALLGERALDLFGRGFGICEGDFVLVYAGGRFLEEVATRSAEHWGLPVETAVLAGNVKDRGIGLTTRTSEIQDGRETERQKVVVPFIWSC
jgi:hypothetical protein